MSERLLFLGTAGTGKTYQLSKKMVDYFIDENRSGNIVGMTKTNAAKNVFRDRVVEIGNVVGSFDDVVDFARRNIKTIASFSLDVVNFPREEIRNRIIDVVIEENIFKGNYDKIFEIVENFGLRRKYINPFALSVKTYPGAFNLKGDEKYFYAIKILLSSNDWKDYRNVSSNDIKNFVKIISPYFDVYYKGNVSLNIFENVFDKFVNYLEKNNFETFETILIDAVNNLKNSGNIFDYVFVDEANELSYLDLKFIMHASKNVYFGMDPFQTIYNIMPIVEKTQNELINFVKDKVFLYVQKRCKVNVFRFAKDVFFSKIDRNFIERYLGNFGVVVYDYLKRVRNENTSNPLNRGDYYYKKLNKDALIAEILDIIKSENVRRTTNRIAVLTRRKSYEYKIKKYSGYPCSKYGVYIDAILNILRRVEYEPIMLDDIKHLMKPKTYKLMKIKGISFIDYDFVKNYDMKKFIRDFFDVNERDYELIIQALRVKYTKRVIEVRTIHEAKGSEYDCVILIRDMRERFYEKMMREYPVVFLQEIFILFCGITRAIDRIYYIEL